MLKQIRHSCNARLFDSGYEVQVLTGPLPDLAIKCQRCSKAQKSPVIAQYRLRLPHAVAPIIPEPIYCANLVCLARICDLSLPYTLVESGGDIEMMCHKCKELTRVRIEGVVLVRGGLPLL